jgi:ribose 5-phosphate isomerase B
MIYIAGDNNSYNIIQNLEKYFKLKNLDYVNLGVKGSNEDMKLEEFIPDVVTEVLKNENNLGILSCGTGVGVEVGANKFKGIRACLATDEKIAEWSVVYDKCNVLCLAGWGAEEDKVIKIVKTWLNSEYDGDINRLKMFEVFDSWK